MNYIFALIVPFIFLASFVYAAVKRVKIYDSFCDGIKGAPRLILSVFPYVAAVTMLAKLMEVSGLQTQMERFFEPIFHAFGVPEQISGLIFMKPLSGGGSIAALTEILDKYGVDGYIGRCACVAYGASDTIFYIGAVYFAGLKRKKITAALFIALTAYFLSIILCCFLCRFL